MIIREARPDEYAAVGELRVVAYRALGLLPEGSGYAETLRGFGFADDCVVLVAASEAGSGILGTITLEPFGSANELAQDETEADVRAFAVAPQAQGQAVGRKLLLAVIECAGKRGVCCLRLCTQSAMKAAQHLYTRTGFSRTPDLDFEPVPGITLQAYELALPPSPFPVRQPDEQPVWLSLARGSIAAVTNMAVDLENRERRCLTGGGPGIHIALWIPRHRRTGWPGRQVVHLQSGHGLDDVALVQAGAGCVVGIDYSQVAVRAAPRGRTRRRLPVRSRRSSRGTAGQRERRSRVHRERSPDLAA